MTEQRHFGRSVWRWVVRVVTGGAAALVVALLLGVLLSAEVRFVLRAAYEEARILLARQSIAELLDDPDLGEDRRAMFRLVLDARNFAGDSLGLAAGDTYTTFAEVGRDTLVLVVTGARRDTLAPFLWRYPIVGAVPYKGFFDFEAASATATQLEREGYDTYLRPSAAFSTLGWFNDPLLSTALRRGPVSLVELVIHEIAHNTVYVPDATPFDESFALFVGYRGAEAFFLGRGDTARAERVRTIWRDQKRLSGFYADLVTELEALYAAHLPVETRERERQALFDRARERLMGPLAEELEAFDAASVAERPLNNASLLAFRIYLTDVDLFDRLLAEHGGDLRSTVGAIRAAIDARGDRDPFEVLATMVPH